MNRVQIISDKNQRSLKIKSAVQKKINQTIIKEIKPPKLICQKNILPKNHMPLLTVMIDRKIIGDFQFKECRPTFFKLKITNYFSIDHDC